MIEIIRNIPKVESNEAGEVFNLYQLQIEGLNKGWLIYPETLNPLTLAIKKNKTIFWNRGY